MHRPQIPWLIAIAFWLSGGFIRSGLGARIAYSIVSLFGKTTLGLTYSLVAAEALLAPAIPSVAARAGGLFLPLAKALCLACGEAGVGAGVGAEAARAPACIHACAPRAALQRDEPAPGSEAALSMPSGVAWANPRLCVGIAGLVHPPPPCCAPPWCRQAPTPPTAPKRRWARS